MPLFLSCCGHSMLTQRTPAKMIFNSPKWKLGPTLSVQHLFSLSNYSISRSWLLGTHSASSLLYLVDYFLEGSTDPFLWDNKLLALGCKVNMIYGEGGNEKYICLKYFQESSLNGILAVRPKYKGLMGKKGNSLFYLENGHIKISPLPSYNTT